jgi:death-on-curing protein
VSLTWSSAAIVRALHAKLLAEHGGLPGAPQIEVLEHALARPHDLLACDEIPRSLPALAAAYGFALARAHCFPDGNKRLALAVIDVFLQLNGHELTASEVEAVWAIRELDAGALSEPQLADWIEAHCQPLPRPS